MHYKIAIMISGHEYNVRIYFVNINVGSFLLGSTSAIYSFYAIH